MERVGFLIEATNERISCLLNPEHFTVTRHAGVGPVRSVGGLLGARALGDDPLLALGGGVTELDLRLLFDTSVQEPPQRAADVRDLTRPLWQLAEGLGAPGRGPALARVRFLWGKSWNVLGVVLAVSERFEQFAASGAPQRSWLHLRLRRVPEQVADDTMSGPATPPDWGDGPTLPAAGGAPAVPADVYAVQGDGLQSGSRLDTLAAQVYGDPAAWRAIAAVNDLASPFELVAGQLLQLPAALSVAGSGRLDGTGFASAGGTP
ncbi:hypothetical protein HNQ07_002219 [Deinococcus metalli]|uniref:Contractile injection system tube protein N-terminal domain-containing protein n=1 Tax=Deinococcus metalli TaxID=1141878 RepID=A0A7W8KF43_9DEIO|nr:hypothetical protein [Deinococcus metalli]MBB5376755.1 hypothetical protein [Deinococcus metalli]GHF45116.1 hypothetical protein GCM10017781_21840 [Deinococcus metalli]